MLTIDYRCGFEVLPGMKCGITFGVGKGEGVGQVSGIGLTYVNPVEYLLTYDRGNFAVQIP